MTKKKREPQQFQYLYDIRGVETNLIIDYLYFPGDPGVHTYPNGDPGYPPTGPEIEIISIYSMGVQIFLSEEDDEKIEEAIIEHEESKDLWN